MMRIIIWFGLVFILGLPHVWAADAGTVEGSLLLIEKNAAGEEKPLRNRDLSGIVCYLLPDGHTVDPIVPKTPVRMSQKGAKFQPGLLVVVRGQTVEFPNDDTIDHNVFSFSKPKKFDLGLYKKGVTKSVVFDQSGPVALFCSIHSNMNGFVYVCPTHLYGISDAKGNFFVRDVPIGKYRVFTWHRNLPEGRNSIEVSRLSVEKGEKISVTIHVGSTEEE